MAKFPEIFFSHIVEADPFYKAVITDILAQRSLDTHLSILDLCIGIGKIADQVLDEDIGTKQAEREKERFFIAMYFLVKFMYPIIDQLEMAGEKHLKIRSHV